jgi:hypothetical protein
LNARSSLLYTIYEANHEYIGCNYFGVSGGGRRNRSSCALKARRSQQLKTRFGPEYGRAVEQTGNKSLAEAKLEKLEKRVQRFKLTPLSVSAQAEFLAEWKKIQSQFVDDPKIALTQGDELIQRIMTARGYPPSDFEQRAADVSVDHPLVVEHYRAGREISLRHAQGRATTEDMRQAMIHYRTLFNELSGEPEMARAATVGRV